MMNTGDRSEYNLECRDPVHGFVRLSKAEWAIVDCPTFQRLRDIRQLAMAHLVYPGATHTRFEHSLGCLHLSDRIWAAIKRQVDQNNCPNFAHAFRADNRQEKHGLQILRLAGLLHDLGHTPFSHSGEKLMPEVEKNSKKRRINHEEMTARLIRDTDIADKLKDEFKEDITEEIIAVATSPELANLPQKADLAWYRFLNDIIAGELGSDRMDYLLRDALHSGQSVGVFDHHKLIDSMTIVPPPEETGEEYRLGLDGSGWLIGEQMVAARYLMYVALYFHKTKRIYELHLEEFLAKWLEGEFGQPHFPVDNLDKYVQLTDSTVWAAIYNAAKSTDNELKKLASPFVDRSHLRLAYELLPADNHEPPASDNSVDEILQSFGAAIKRRDQKENVDQIVSELRTKIGSIVRRRHPRIWNGDRFDKLVEAVNNYVSNMLGSTVRHDQTRHQAAKFFGSKNKIWVYMAGQTRYLDDLSEIVSGMPDKICRGRIYSSIEFRENVKAFCNKWLDEHRPDGATNDVDNQPRK